MTSLDPKGLEAFYQVISQFFEIVPSTNALEAGLRAYLLASPAALSTAGTAEPAWQPIETAPKDGKRVDLWVRPWDAFANGNPGRITDAWFEDGEWKRHLAGWPHNVSSCGEPTHWMSLASPPSGASEKRS